MQTNLSRGMLNPAQVTFQVVDPTVDKLQGLKHTVATMHAMVIDRHHHQGLIGHNPAQHAGIHGKVGQIRAALQALHCFVGIKMGDGIHNQLGRRCLFLLPSGGLERSTTPRTRMAMSKETDSQIEAESSFVRPTESIHSPVWQHVIPFVAWLFVMQMLGDPEGWKYALRSALCLGLFFYFRPWKYYPPLQLKNVGIALVGGVFVFFAWIFFETRWMEQWPKIQNLYLLIGTMMPWEIKEITLNDSYSPAVCGWHFTATRIIGSAFVIAFIEEFFFRGFIYRWMFKEEFTEVDIGEFDWKIFLGVALFFGIEHHRWIMGVVAGIVYCAIMIRTRDIWAAGIAHAVTNLLLGLYVVWADQYQFWS